MISLNTTAKQLSSYQRGNSLIKPLMNSMGG